MYRVRGNLPLVLCRSNDATHALFRSVPMVPGRRCFTNPPVRASVTSTRFSRLCSAGACPHACYLLPALTPTPPPARLASSIAGARVRPRSSMQVQASASGAAAELPLPRFTYFDGRGHGQRVRYALAGAAMQWEEVLLTAAGDMDTPRQLCLFGQVPLLEIDGLKLVQSWTIVRYLGSKQQLPAERAWVADACAEQVRDWYTEAGYVGFGWSQDRGAEVAKARAATARFLLQFEQVLSAAFLTGSSPCWADFQLLLALDYSVDVLGAGCLDAAPKCRALRQALRALPCMQAFYASDRCKGLVDQQYKDQVKAVLSAPRK